MKKYAIYLLGVLLISCTQKETEVSQWRGENRDGIYLEENLLDSWPEDGPELLWANENVGNGYGAPTIAHERVYLNGEIDSTAYLLALDLKGEELWRADNGVGFVKDGFVGRFPGSRSAPTVVGDKVYAMSGEGRLGCFDAHTGEEIWGVHLLEDLNGIMNSFGYADSPLIDGDLVFCFPGGAENNAAALNRHTGEVVWTAKALGDTISYNSAMLIELPERKIVVNHTTKNIIGLDASTGELLWNHKQEKKKYDQMCNTPIYYENHLYYLAGDGNGAVKLSLSEDGSSIQELWRNDIARNAFYGFVIVGEKLYTSDSNKFLAHDIENGAVSDTIRMKQASCIAADQKLICYSNNGTVSLVDISGDKMLVKGEFKVDKGTKEHFSRPVIADGVLYIRRGQAIMAWGLTDL